MPVDPQNVEIITSGSGTHSARREPTIAERLDRLEKLTHLMDEAFTIPGTNRTVGWDSIIGLVPIVGDLIGVGISAYMIREARQMGASRWTLLRMMKNAGIDATVGFIPVAGDAFDAAFKANRKNLEILKKHLRKKAEKEARV